MEGKRTVLIAVPEHTSLGEFHFLLARNQFALGKVRLVEREVNLLTAHDAHRDIRLLTVII